MKLVYHADGTVDLDAYVRLQVYGTARAETYDLESFALGDANEGVVWTVDSVEDPGPWPVTVAGPLAFATRGLRVRAHAVPPGEATHPLFDVTVVHDGASLPVGMAHDYAPSVEPCGAPSLEPAAKTLGGTIGWSTSTLGELVNDSLALAVDPRGRVYYATNFYGPHDGVRVFARSPPDNDATFEAFGADARIVAGNGSGPTLATLDAGAITVTRLDAMLRPVWSHVLSNTSNAYVTLASSHGRVLTNVYANGPLVLDGEARPEQASSLGTLVLFDEDTGDLVDVDPFERPVHAIGISGGGFALSTVDGRIVALDADLHERWSVQHATTALAPGPDGRIWANRGGFVDLFADDGTFVFSFATPTPLGGYWRSFAPTRDGKGVVVANDAVVALYRDDGTSAVAPLPALIPAWCGDAYAAFDVVGGEHGIALVARPTLAPPSPQRFAVLARLDL